MSRHNDLFNLICIHRKNSILICWVKNTRWEYLTNDSQIGCVLIRSITNNFSYLINVILIFLCLLLFLLRFFKVFDILFKLGSRLIINFILIFKQVLNFLFSRWFCERHRARALLIALKNRLVQDLVQNSRELSPVLTSIEVAESLQIQDHDFLHFILRDLGIRCGYLFFFFGGSLDLLGFNPLFQVINLLHFFCLLDRIFLVLRII